MSTQRDMVGAVLAMMLVQTVVMVGVVAVPVMAPLLSDAVGLPQGFAGAFQSLAFAAATIATIVAGTLVGRYGGVRINQLCCLLTAIGLCIPVFGLSAAFVLGALVAGAGYGMATPGASHVLARVTPAHQRGFVFSVKQSAVTLGGLVAGLVVPTLAQTIGWQTTLLTLAVLAASCALLVQPLRAKLDADRDPYVRLDLRAVSANVALVWNSAVLRPICVAAFFFASIQCALFALYVTMLVDQVALSLVEAGWLYAVMQGTGVVARIGWGWANDRGMSAQHILAGIGVATTIAAVLLDSASAEWSWSQLVAISVVLGATAVSWNGVYLAEIPRRVAAAQVGAATSGTVMFSFMGVVVGPASFSLVNALTGSYTIAFTGFSAAILASVAYLLWSPKT